MTVRALDDLKARLAETNPEALYGTPERIPARARWSPVYLRVYGLRPWEFTRLTIKETNMLADDLEKHGLGF